MANMTTDGILMMNCLCQKCNEIFAIPARRGRPPLFCQQCLNSDHVPSYEDRNRDIILQAANARVDNLEMLLRSRGTHIGQHRDKWE